MNQSGPMENGHNIKSEATANAEFLFGEDVHLSLHSSHDSESESLAEEIKYQSELQQWIFENGELVDHSSDELYDSLNEDDDVAERVKEEKLNAQGHMKISGSSSRRRHQVVDHYAELRYDPNWKTKKVEATSPDLGKLRQLELEKGLQDSFQESTSSTEEAMHEKLQMNQKQTGQEQRGAGKDLVSGSGNVSIIITNGLNLQQLLLSPQIPENKSDFEVDDSALFYSSNRLNEANHRSIMVHRDNKKVQKSLIDSQQDKVPDLYNHDVSSFGLMHEQGSQSTEDCNSDTQGKLNDAKGKDLKRIHPKRNMSVKDFIEKNKLTLGVAAQKRISYLQMHKTKNRETKQEQIASTAEAVADPLPQNIREDELSVLDPETKWKENAQRLKDHKNTNFQSDWTSSDHIQQSRSSKLKDKHHPAGRQLQNISNQNQLLGNSNRKPKTSQELELVADDSGSSCYLWNANVSIHPIRPAIKHSLPTTHWNSDLKPLANINPSVIQNHKQATMNFVSSKCPPEERYILSQAFIGRHFEELQHLPSYLSQDVHKYLNPLDVDRHVLLNQSRALATLGAHSYESPTESHIMGVSAGNSHHGNAGSWQFLSPSFNHLMASSSTMQVMQTMGQPFYQVPPITDFHHGETLLSNPVLPPILSREESDSTLYGERSSERSQATISHINSEDYLLQMEAQKQQKDRSNGKIIRLKGYMNQKVKLGGLGPDYEVIKEKSEQLKQQKEYAKRVNEHNKRSMLFTSKPPAKAAIQNEKKSSISRFKALEYAKKIPKPKLHSSAIPSVQEVQEEHFMMLALEEKKLPPITLLEELQYRHEKEKEAVAALRMIHIL
uniref:Jhy protein homolog n=1 Tax=Geotrypetes seraphini TaxID=260995 RepID=A0A6P8NBT4_GEOSA|nr:jhy protein homolog [Geotrypetes seraphini]XP_033773190.1 jhy protein homolog [Geotrypetes seraphini]XP_033773191.1 jhy protein homolog [Geotrypetes seraphini]XP_033773192.1 jhy protein homolog [Geotrypetes seraphini]